MTTKTIREIALAWKSDKQRYVKQSTFAAYVLILENHILPSFGDCEALSEKLVQEFVLQKLNGGLSIKTVKDILIVLKMVMKFLRELYLVLTEICRFFIIIVTMRVYVCYPLSVTRN